MPRKRRLRGQKTLIDFLKKARKKKKNSLVLGKVNIDELDRKRIQGLLKRDKTITSRIKKVLLRLLKKHLGVNRVMVKYEGILLSTTVDGIAYISVVHGKMKMTLDFQRLIKPRNEREREILRKLKKSNIIMDFRFDYWYRRGYDLNLTGYKKNIKLWINASERGTNVRWEVIP